MERLFIWDEDGNNHWLLELNMVDPSLIAFMRLNEHKILVFINDTFFWVSVRQEYKIWI